jgi:tetratricopeptide (TPR) repeat protein
MATLWTQRSRRLPIRLMTALATAATLTALGAWPAAAQIPQTFENLQVLPKDIPRDSLVQTMRGFAFALGVRCTYCHVGEENAPLDRVNFKADDKAAKRKARFMLRMTDRLNAEILAPLPERSDPPVRVDCVTCHRGSPLPKTLDVVLAEVIEQHGADSAVARYRQLREQTMPLGRYNFGEWTLNELARTLGAREKTAEAIAMLELNAEFYPASAAIDLQLAELHRTRGERDKAIARYRSALTKQPNNPQARRRLAELTGGPGTP